MLTKKELAKTAKELNEILGLKPKLDASLKAEELIPKIKKAISLIIWEEDGDGISDDVKKVINELLPERVPEETEPDEVPENEVVEEKPKKTPKKKVEKEKKRTKKSVVIEMIGTDEGATIEEIAQVITNDGIDPDFDKNKTVVKLWLSKMGYDTKKAAIEKDPRFKSK